MKTLKIQLPTGSFIFQSLTYILIFCLVLEILARTSLASKVFAYESYGSSHPHFDIQIVQINEREKKEGKIDCILLGNSEILAGADPELIEKVYFENTGKKIVCQSFGLAGLTPITANLVARILIKNYNPAVIIFGTNLFDFLPEIGEGAKHSISSSPWVKYQLGDFSIDGWLIENSHAYRYYLGVDQYLSSKRFAGGNGYLYTKFESNPELIKNGHTLVFSNYIDLNLEEQIDYYNSRISRPDIELNELEALRAILSLNSETMKIVIVEMPVTPHLISIRPKLSILYTEFTNTLLYLTNEADSELWLTQSILQIPESGWYDIQHLNQIGKIYFSTIIGENLSQLQINIRK